MSVKKKVVFCTYASVYSSKVLHQLIADEEIDVVAIINSTRVLRPSLNSIQAAIEQLKISGLLYSAYLFIITDFFKLIQSCLFLKHNHLKSVAALAKLNKIPLLNTRNINSADIVQFIQDQNTDFLLCAHFNQLLKEPVLDIEQIKCINIHPSLLPKYKGVDPVFFAMKDNSEQVGVSLHEMDEGFDSGNILIQSSIQMSKNKSLFINNCRLFEEGARLALKFIKNETLNKPEDENTNNDQSYDSWPTSEDVREFKKLGNRLISLGDLWKKI